MELRSSRQLSEYKELQITLNGMGFYEEGMELQEMRQILEALQMSVTETETNFSECDLQQAIRESELDFLPSRNGQNMNSTMISSHENISYCSSPEIPPQIIVIQADVHHPMDWSPPNERMPRKRLAPSPSAADNDTNTQSHQIISDLLEPNAKRFHEIHGPVSMRRIQDSGVNMSNENEMPSSSSYNTSNENFLSNDGSGNHIENYLQFSTSSAAMSGENDDYEQSEPSM